MLMFLGITSSAISGESFCRLTRLRNAMATARFAADWPITYLSSSRTISRGVSSSRWGISTTGSSACIRQFDSSLKLPASLQRLHRNAFIRVNADLSSDVHRFFCNFACAELSVLCHGAGRRQRVGTARADGDQTVIRLDQIAVSGDEKSVFV